MTKLRVLLFVLTIIVVGTLGTVAFYYARGYRFDTKTLSFTPRGLLVAESDPNGAQVYVDGELVTATNATITLAPGIYDVKIQKEGYLTWQKRLVIEKEIVTKVDVKLFSVAPSLSAVTFAGAATPLSSPDLTKIAYSVPATKDSEKEGLWVIESISLPIGFNRDPRQVTDADMTDAEWVWSPDSREILLTTSKGVFLINSSDFTAQSQLVNVAARKAEILTEWEQKADERLKAKLAKLPDELEEILVQKATNVVFSPDENKIMYTATGGATIKKDLISQLPGSSTQTQERDIKPGSTYVYDIKEDRNFKIGGEGVYYWLPTSAHLVVPEEGKIVVMDYDGTNGQTVYAGSYATPYAFPYANNSQLLVLTNLGSGEETLNLYALNLK